MEISRFDSFADIPRNNSITKEYVKAYSPVASIINNEIVEFNVLPTSYSFIDLSKTRLKIKIELYDVATDALVNSDNYVAPVANVLESLFRSIELQLNDVDVEPYVGVNHPYKAYINTVLNATPEYVSSVGAIKGFYPDTAPHVNSFIPRGANQGWNNRVLLFQSTGEAEMTGFLDLDICETTKYVPNGMGLKLKLFLSKPAFYLKTAEEEKTYNYRLTLCTLYMAYIDPHIDIFNAFNEAIHTKMAVYPYTKSNIKSYVISSGVKSTVLDNIVSECPDEIIICLVANSAYVGATSENPFYFDTFNINYISLAYEGTELNGQSFHPIFDPADVNTYQTTFADTYMNLYLKNGAHSKGNLVGPFEYSGGYFLIKYDLPPSLKYTRTKQSVGPGLTRLSLGFSEATTKTISLLVYTRTKSYFGIDAKRTVHLNIDQY